MSSPADRRRPAPTEHCAHPRTLLLRLDCGAGGVQFRHHCVSCWHAGVAIPHAEILDPESVPLADLDVLGKAREAALHKRMGWRRR